MMFEEITLGSVAKVISGYAFKSATFKDGGSTPVLKIKNIKIGTASLEDAGYVSGSHLSSLDSKFQVKADDILISLTGSHMTQPNSVVGRVGRYPKSFPTALLNQRAGKIIPNTELIDANYLFHVLMDDSVRREIAQFAHGAASQANVSPKQVESVLIPFPSLHTQKLIGAALCSYDNLIENNNRRIAILEEMAQSLYREWFVKFRFPGHDQCQMVDSPLGLIPEGWAVDALKEVCQLTMGQSPKSEFYNQTENGLPFYQGVKDYGKRFPSVSVWCSKPTRIAEIGDILFSVRAPVGRLNIANSQMAIGRGLSAIRHKDGYQSFLFQQLKNIFSREDLIGNGAIFNAVTKKDMEQIQLICPPETILKSFAEVLDPIFRQLEVLCIKNDNLKAQRDLLLPKLISGQIDLSQAEQESA